MNRPPLRAVDGTRCDHGHLTDSEGGQQVVVEVRGQRLQVHAARPLAGPGSAQIVVHLGDVVLVVRDQDAVLALREAADGVGRLADWTFE